MLRFVCLVFAGVLAMASVGTAGAVESRPPIAAPPVHAALYPDDIFHPVDLGTFSFTLRRELSGSGATRQFDFYQEYWDSKYPGFVPPRVNNGPFLIEWVGDYESPGRFAQSGRVGGSPNIYTEWFDGDDGRVQYKDNAIVFATGGDIEALFWWEHFLTWLDDYGDAVTCSNATRLINDEQAFRCTAPTLSREARVALVDAAGLYGDGYSETVSRATLELWLTRNDSIPVRLDISVAGVDEYGDAFGGTFKLDFFDLDSEDISVELPR